MRGQLKNRRDLRPADLARRYERSFNTIMSYIRAGRIVARPERVNASGDPSGFIISRAEVERLDRDGLVAPTLIFRKGAA